MTLTIVDTLAITECNGVDIAADASMAACTSKTLDRAYSIDTTVPSAVALIAASIGGPTDEPEGIAFYDAGADTTQAVYASRRNDRMIFLNTATGGTSDLGGPGVAVGPEVVKTNSGYNFGTYGESDGKLIARDASTWAASSVGGHAGIHGIALNGSYAFVSLHSRASGEFGPVTAAADFRIIDISSPPTSMPQIGTLTDGTYFAQPRMVAVDAAGDYAYVADNTNDSLVVVDCTTKASPVVAGDVAGITEAGGVAVIDAATVIVVGNGVAAIVDVSNPTAPSILETLTDAQLAGAVDVAYANGVIVVAAKDADLFVVLSLGPPIIGTWAWSGLV